MVNQVKQAYFSCLLSKEAFNVYKSVYENALENFNQTQRKYNVQKASDLDLARAKTALANAVPNVYNAESSVILALWQLKAVMGIMPQIITSASNRLTRRFFISFILKLLLNPPVKI